MDEIAALQAQLAAVQQQEAALKLSDHNVVDLLFKLQQLGKLQLVHTLTGKEILTPKQIEREIEDHVTLNGGRSSLSELQQALGVDRAYIERHVAQVAKASRGAAASQFFVINNGEEVVTNWYLDAIMEDTNTLLQEAGTCSVGELAQQYGFAVEYMKDVVASRLGSILQAQERGNVLYTNSFVETQKAQIRGVFAAITRPTLVPEILRTYKFDPKVTDEFLNELIQQHVLLASLRGREFVPRVFVDAQRENMFSFFQQNGYLDNARANRLQVARPYDFLKKRFADAVALKSCVVSHTLFMQMESSIEVAVQDASYVDLRHILPSAIHSADIAMLATKSPFLARDAKDAVQLCEVYVVSTALIDSCLEAFKTDAASKATAAAAQRSFASAQMEAEEDQTDIKNEEDDDEEEGNGKRGKRGKARRGKAAADEPKPKNSKGKRGKKGANASDDHGSKREAKISITPSREDASALIVKTCPHAEDDDELLDSLVDHLEGDIQNIYATALATAMSSILRGDAVSRRELRKKFEDKFDEAYTLLSCYEKGYCKLEIRVDAKDAIGMAELKNIEIHLLETLGVDLASLVTSFIAAAHNLEMEDVPAFDAIVAKPVEDEQASSTPPVQRLTTLTEDNKKVLEKNLPPSVASAIVRLWTLSKAGRRSLSDLMVHIPVVTNALSMPLRKIDRKRERQVIFGCRQLAIGALEQVDDDDQGATSALLAQLFLQQCTSLPILLPPNVATAAMVFRAFESAITPERADKHRAFVAAAVSSSPPDEWSQLVEEVRTLVLTKDSSAAAGAQ